MPKISDERKTERREQILSAARRCFAKHGDQGATVVRLENATGLSRGAIFNYFGSKEDLFLELAARDNERLVQLWIEKGSESTLREVVHEDPDGIGVYMEMGRKIRTDPEFKRRYEARTQESLAPPLLEARPRRAGARGALRADAPPEQIVRVHRPRRERGGGSARCRVEPIRNVEALIEFVCSAVTGRAPTGTHPRTRP